LGVEAKDKTKGFSRTGVLNVKKGEKTPPSRSKENQLQFRGERNTCRLYGKSPREKKKTAANKRRHEWRGAQELVY